MGEQKEGQISRDDYVKWFSELSNKDVSIAGGKGASLSEMYSNKFPVPPGFVVSAQAYKHFMDESGAWDKVYDILKGLDVNETAELNKASKEIREIIEKSEMPKDLDDEILEAYNVLDVDKGVLSEAKGGALDILKNSHEGPFVAVRSSATTEDLADASFAGQQDTFLNVKGGDDLLKHVKKCFSSLFTPRAIYYRSKKGFDHEKAYLAVVVQRMVDAQKSGVMFSKNPLKNDNSIVIEAVWGLGEGIVSGKILPDHYVLNKDLEIAETKVSEKKVAVTRDSSGKVVTVNLTPEKSKLQVLDGHELKKLAQYALRLEQHYKKPQDIEFAIENGEIYIVQSRPITTQANLEGPEVSGNVLLTGLAASPGVSSGVVKIVHDLSELEKVQKGDVLVTKMTNPDMVVSMEKAAGIVTDEGGVTSHAAIVSREMGIPCVVGTKEATTKLKDGQAVTVDGLTGRVIEGRGEERKAEINPIVQTKTKIKVIVDLPSYAERAAKSGSDSVGLVRTETIIAGSGKHPLWYLKNDALQDYTKVLYEGMKKIMIPFKEVWFRSSDVRSDEYHNLEGAPKKVEGNPMLGDHGIRFSLKNVDLLEAEFLAVKEVADDLHDKIVGIMIPQVISVSEVRETKKVAEKVGFPKNVRVGIMIETPAAVQVIDDLLDEGVDFISFGTNDLTQYTLAIDRNNPDVQVLHDEMNPAVLNSIASVLKSCKSHGVESSICGQAGSKPEMAKFLVERGISSISVNADAAEKVSKVVAEVESGRVEARAEAEGDVIENKSEDVGEVRKTEAGKESGNDVVEENLDEGDEIKSESDDTMDEQELFLKELGDEEDEYNPSLGEKKNEVPSLNDAIPVNSDMFDDFFEGKDEGFEEREDHAGGREVNEEDVEDDENRGVLDEISDEAMDEEMEEMLDDDNARHEIEKFVGAKIREGDELEDDKDDKKKSVGDGADEVLDIF